MENNLSIGTYSISSDGMSINYVAPSILPKEMMEKITFSQHQQDEKKIELENSFDSLLNGVLSAPKANK